MAPKVILLLFNIILLLKCTTSSPQSRILEGSIAKPKEFPFVVFARSDPPERSEVGSHICSGSILTDKWVLTAAQCYRVYLNHVKLDQVKSTVLAGSTDVRTRTPETQIRRSRRHVIMEKDRSKTFDELFNNDIALIELVKPFKFNKFVSPATIALTYPYGTKMTCDVIGFGSTRRPAYTDEPLTNTVLHHTQGYLDGRNDSCKEKAMKSGYGHIQDWDLGHLCMDPVEYTSAPCEGDSGGPLVCEGLLTGILSGKLNMNAKEKSQCGMKGNYHVYSFVGFFSDWIRKHVPDLPPGSILKDGPVRMRFIGRESDWPIVSPSDGKARGAPDVGGEKPPSAVAAAQTLLNVTALTKCYLYIAWLLVFTNFRY